MGDCQIFLFFFPFRLKAITFANQRVWLQKTRRRFRRSCRLQAARERAARGIYQGPRRGGDVSLGQKTKSIFSGHEIVIQRNAKGIIKIPTQVVVRARALRRLDRTNIYTRAYVRIHYT